MMVAVTLSLVELVFAALVFLDLFWWLRR